MDLGFTMAFEAMEKLAAELNVSDRLYPLGMTVRGRYGILVKYVGHGVQMFLGKELIKFFPVDLTALLK